MREGKQKLLEERLTKLQEARKRLEGKITIERAKERKLREKERRKRLFTVGQLAERAGILELEGSHNAKNGDQSRAFKISRLHIHW